jgi:hypothetical protein
MNIFYESSYYLFSSALRVTSRQGCSIFPAHFATLSASNSVMTDGERWIGKDLEGRGHGLIEALYGLLPGGAEEFHENPDKTACDPAEMRTEYLPNTTLERYRQLTPLIFNLPQICTWRKLRTRD